MTLEAPTSSTSDRLSGAAAVAQWRSRSGPWLDVLAQRVVTADPRSDIAVCAPWTGEQLGSVPACTAEDVALAVGQARLAQQAWADRPVGDRRRVLLNYHRLILDRQDTLLDLVQVESGKARLSAFEEVLDVAVNSRYYGIHGPKFLRDRSHLGALPFFTATREVRQPVGVVGIIAPWNYPLTMAISDALPALMAGNAVILKPATETPFSAIAAVALLEEAGLPPHVCQVVTGRGSELGTPILDSVDSVCFTGSSETGRAIAQQAGDRLLPCSLELGGKNPMIVLADADLDRAVEGAARACFGNAGQLCMSIERIYIQRPLYDRFVEALVAHTQQLTLGAALDYGPAIGSLISPAHQAKVHRLVEAAIAQGAQCLSGGRPRPDLGPCFYEPTLLSQVTPAMALSDTEVFGPVVALYPFDDPAEAIRAANASPYGLNASLWTRNLRLGRQLASQLQCGSVNLNEGYIATWGSVAAPLGGHKASGLGVRHGQAGLLRYTRSQTVATQRGVAIAPSFGLSPQQYAHLMTLALRLLRHLPGLR